MVERLEAILYFVGLAMLAIGTFGIIVVSILAATGIVGDAMGWWNSFSCDAYEGEDVDCYGRPR